MPSSSRLYHARSHRHRKQLDPVATLAAEDEQITRQRSAAIVLDTTDARPSKLFRISVGARHKHRRQSQRDHATVLPEKLEQCRQDAFQRYTLHTGWNAQTVPLGSCTSFHRRR
ncbi:MAG: hypothetical protein U0796_00235 [Gemmatales bacterium]